VALERGLILARATGDRAAETEALVDLSYLATERGDYDNAWALAEAALPLGRALGGRLFAMTQRRAAGVLDSIGNLEAAEAYALEALEASRSAGYLPGEIKALNMLGGIASTHRHLEQARDFYLRCQTLARQANLLDGEATALVNLGNNAYLLGDYAAARVYGRQALERYQELGQLPSVALALGNLAQAELKLGDAAAARAGVRQAIVLARSLGHQPHVFWLVSLVAQILAATGEETRAMALYALARAHPALTELDRVEIDEEVARMGMPAADVAAGLAAGAALDPEATVDEILEGKW
jgi:tetratricopeptide (TPR) repeat protein